MKKMISTAILSACVLLSTSVYAQRGDRGNRPERNNRYEKLDLTDKQKEEMKSVNDDFRIKMKQLNEDKSIGEDARKEKSKELRTAQRDKVNSILTADQQANLKKMRKDRPVLKNRDRMAPGGGKFQKGRKSPRGRAEEMQRGNKGNMMRHLDLTDTQKQEMKSIREKYALKEKELKEQQKREMAGVITAEQQAKLKQVQVEKVAQKHKITNEGADKLLALKENFVKEKQAIKMSRIAPKVQKERVKEATEKYRKEVKELKEKYRL